MINLNESLSELKGITKQLESMKNEAIKSLKEQDPEAAKDIIKIISSGNRRKIMKFQQDIMKKEKDRQEKEAKDFKSKQKDLNEARSKDTK